jgi:S-adenosylmethionine decarboxylase
MARSLTARRLHAFRTRASGGAIGTARARLVTEAKVSAMENLAPDILRQRLLIEGYFTIDIDEAVISRYFEKLTTALSLRTYGAPTIFAPGGAGRAENAGYDAFVPLIDSGVSLYVWSVPKFLSVVAFTCKQFDVPEALAVTHDFFAMSRIAHQTF